MTDAPPNDPSLELGQSPQPAPQAPPARGAKAHHAGMPLRYRIPAILAGIAILWWVMNGGATVLITAAVEHIARPDRSIEGAPSIAAKKRPEGTEWLQDLLNRACSETSVVPSLRGLDFVIFHDGIRDESLPDGIHSGCFYHAASERAYFDVACLAAIDQFAPSRPDLVKAFAVTIVLAQRAEPDLDGEALVAAAGRLASRLKFFPPSPAARTAAAIALYPVVLGLFDKSRGEDTPPGWINHPMLPAVAPDVAARAFSAGLAE